jgi:hypothetical protein
VGSNATVIGNQEPEIDIEKIKKILDKKYNEQPRRKSIRVEPREEEARGIIDDTKEYDLNVVLEKAKDEKVDSYAEERAKKLRNTQFDILNSLHINNLPTEDDEELEKNKNSEENLMELINTITINEARKKEKIDDDPLDILEDLKGSENTQVYEGMSSNLQEVSSEVSVKEEVKLVEKEPEEQQEKQKLEKPEAAKKSEIDNSFYTGKLFKKKDFVDDDFLDDTSLSIWVKILIGLVVIAFLIGIFLFLKSFLGF